MSTQPITFESVARRFADVLGDPDRRETRLSCEAYLWTGALGEPVVEVFERGGSVRAYARSPLALLPFLVVAESEPEGRSTFPRFEHVEELAGHLGEWPVAAPMATALHVVSSAAVPALAGTADHRRASAYLRWAASATAFAQRSVNDWGAMLAEGPKGGLDMNEHAVLRSSLTRAALRVALWADPLREADEDPGYAVRASWKALGRMAWPAPGTREALAGFDRIRMMVRARLGEPVPVEALGEVWQADVAGVAGDLVQAPDALATMARLVAAELRREGA